MRNAVWFFSMILCAVLSASPAFAQTYSSRENVTSDTTKRNAVIYQNISTTGRLYLGGAIHVNAGKNYTANRAFSAINNSVATSGGALAVAAGASFTAKGDNVRDNAIFRGNKATSSLSGSTIDYGFGGAIYNLGTVKMGNLSTIEIFIENNQASNRGGGIYNAATGIFSLNSRTKIYNNTAKEGGGLYNTGNFSQGENEATAGYAVSFNGNKATSGNGGGIYNSGTVNLWTSYINGLETFIKNTAAVYGGAVYNAASGQMNIQKRSSVIFKQNSATNGGAYYGGLKSALNFLGGKTVFDSNTASVSGNGGAMYTANGSSVSSSGSVDGVRFVNNEAGNGGAIYNEQGAGHLYNSGLTFENNKAAVDGGALYNAGNFSLASSATTLFNGNKTTSLSRVSSGGAVYNAGNFTSTQSVTFTDNSALQGGAVYNERTMTFKESSKAVFQQNTASMDGGAVMNRGTLTFADDADFIGNKATGRSGGGIYNNVGGTVNLFGGTYTFKDNVDSSGLNDIYNGSDLNVGIAGKTTSLNISFVSGAGSTTFDGDVALNAVKDNKIFWHNNITLASGATLNIGTGVLNVGANNFDSSAGTLKLSMAGWTAGSSDYAGGQFVSEGGTVSIGKLFVTVDPSLSFVGKTGELTLLDGYTGDFTADMPGISDGYTISYTENGKFIIERSQAPQPPDNPKPSPTPQAALTAVEVSRANVRAVLNALTARASSGFTAGGYKGRSAGADSQKYGVWAQGMYNNMHYKGVLNANSAGFVTGVDFEASVNAVLGVGYAYTASSADATGASTDIDMHNVFAYARYNPSAVFADFSAGYGFG